MRALGEMKVVNGQRKQLRKGGHLIKTMSVASCRIRWYPTAGVSTNVLLILFCFHTKDLNLKLSRVNASHSALVNGCWDLVQGRVRAYATSGAAWGPASVVHAGPGGHPGRMELPKQGHPETAAEA